MKNFLRFLAFVLMIESGVFPSLTNLAIAEDLYWTA